MHIVTICRANLISFQCVIGGNRVDRREKQLTHEENDAESSAKLYKIDGPLLTPANGVALSAKLARNTRDRVPVASMVLCAQGNAVIGMKETSIYRQ
jgi:hypothetical protein